MMEPTIPLAAASESRRGLFIGFTVASAVIAFLAFPPANGGAIAWVALVPFLLSLSQVAPRQGWWYGWLWGTVFMAGITVFVHQFGVLPWLSLALCMGLFYALFGLVAAALNTCRQPLWRVLGVAGAWALCEMLRGSAGTIAFTFGDLGYSQHEQLEIIQCASLIGHYGIGFLLLFFNAALATVLLALLPPVWYRPGDWREFNRVAGRVALLGFVVMFAVYFGGAFTLHAGRATLRRQVSVKSVSVAAVQGNIILPDRIGPKDVDKCRGVYLGLSQGLPQTDLIVWPETALPTNLNLSASLRQDLSALAQSRQANLIVGATEMTRGHIFNSAYYVRLDGAFEGIYRKMNLVMFGEYVPFRRQLPFLSRYPIRMFDFTAGSRREVFSMPGLQVAPLICFEGTFPQDAREVVGKGADVIAIITSDMWSAGTSELAQHSLTGPFRAIEARKYVIRAASNGLTAIYDPNGEIVAQVPFYKSGVAKANLAAVKTPQSIYHQLGDFPLVLLAALSIALALLMRERQ
jgi:apolipoprotein N-acyltransferase